MPTVLSFDARKSQSISFRLCTGMVAGRRLFSESLDSETPIGTFLLLHYCAMLLNIMSKRLKILLLEDAILWKARWALPMARAPTIRSIWFILNGETIPRFVTAYPLGRRTQ